MRNLTNEEVIKFNELVVECKQMLEDIKIIIPQNITFNTNSRYTRRLGNCRRFIATNNFEISIATHVVIGDDVDYTTTKNTLLHEMLHTLDGCFNHGKTWKYYASLVKKNYGFDISRTGEITKKHQDVLNMGKVIKTLKCESCGKEFSFPETSKYIKKYNDFTCKCGGDLKILEV